MPEGQGVLANRRQLQRHPPRLLHLGRRLNPDRSINVRRSFPMCRGSLYILNVVRCEFFNKCKLHSRIIRFCIINRVADPLDIIMEMLNSPESERCLGMQVIAAPRSIFLDIAVVISAAADCQFTADYYRNSTGCNTYISHSKTVWSGKSVARVCGKGIV